MFSSNLESEDEPTRRLICKPTRYREDVDDDDEDDELIKRKGPERFSGTKLISSKPSFIPSAKYFSALKTAESNETRNLIDNQALVTTQQDSDEFCMSNPPEDHNTERKSVASQESSKFEQAVLLRLNQVDERLPNIERLLRTMMCSKTSEGPEILEKSCNTPEELQDLYTKLKDAAYAKRVIDWLSLKGGNMPGESVRRLLRRLGTNALWAQYSLKGRKGKKSFQKLEICNVIIYACRRTHPKVLEKGIEDFISETLKFAPHRDKMPQSVSLQAETSGNEDTQHTSLFLSFTHKVFCYIIWNVSVCVLFKYVK